MSICHLTRNAPIIQTQVSPPSANNVGGEGAGVATTLDVHM
jgi:hypothetical protein